MAATVYESRAAAWSAVLKLSRSPHTLARDARDRILESIPARGNRLPQIPRSKAGIAEWMRLQDRSGVELGRAVSELGDPVAYLQLAKTAQAARHAYRVYRKTRDAVILANMGACDQVAARWGAVYGRAPTSPSHVRRDDLVQDAVVGLMRAVDLFEPGRDCAFSTYAMPWIEQAIRRAVQRHALVRPPYGMRDENGDHPPTMALSTDAPANFGRGSRPGAKRDALDLLLEDDALAAHDELEHVRHVSDLRRLYERRAGRLRPRERRILDRRLDGASLQQIGDEIGLTRERVRQLESAAMAIIRTNEER